MKIVMIVDDVDPAKAGELMDEIREAVMKSLNWEPGVEYQIGAVDDNCRPAAGEC